MLLYSIFNSLQHYLSSTFMTPVTSGEVGVTIFSQTFGTLMFTIIYGNFMTFIINISRILTLPSSSSLSLFTFLHRQSHMDSFSSAYITRRNRCRHQRCQRSLHKPNKESDLGASFVELHEGAVLIIQLTNELFIFHVYDRLSDFQMVFSSRSKPACTL